MNRKNALPTEYKKSFAEKIRTFFGRTSLYTYVLSKPKYMAFPPKRGFSKKEFDYLSSVCIHTPITENVGISSNQFKVLSSVRISDDVSSISDHTFESLNLEELIIDSSETYFSKKTFDQTDVKRIKYENNKFSLGESTFLLSEIFKDEDHRLNFSIHGRFSSIQELANNQDNMVLNKVQDDLVSLLVENSTINEANSMFIYNEKSESELSYSLNILLDHYPLSDLRMCNQSDDALIALYVSGVDEIDLENLSKYPSLRTIYIAPNVKRVYGQLDNVNHMGNKIMANYNNGSYSYLKVICQSANTVMLGIKESIM